MTLNGVMAVTLRYFTEFGKPALQKTICGGIYARVCIFVLLVREQCRRKESSRSLSHLLMSFLLLYLGTTSHQARFLTRVQLVAEASLSYACLRLASFY